MGQPPTITPSAPFSNAFTMNSGSMRLLHDRRTARTRDPIFTSLAPASSSLVIVHQLQMKSMIRGDHAAGASVFGFCVSNLTALCIMDLFHQESAHMTRGRFLLFPFS